LKVIIIFFTVTIKFIIRISKIFESTNQYLTALHREHLVVLGLPHCSQPTWELFTSLLLLDPSIIPTFELINSTSLPCDPFEILFCHKTQTFITSDHHQEAYNEMQLSFFIAYNDIGRSLWWKTSPYKIYCWIKSLYHIDHS
jgi:hypothetical protein